MSVQQLTDAEIADIAKSLHITKQKSTIVPKKVRDEVYRYLFTEGVMICEKNRLATWTGELGGSKFRVPALQIMYLMKSFKSRGLVKEQFAWRHFYWTLNDEGIAYLRKYLFLDADVVPNTQRAGVDVSEFEKRGPRPEGGRGGRGRGGRGEGGRGRGRGGRGRGGVEGDDREQYLAEEGRGRGRGRGRGGRGRGGADGEETAAPVEAAPVQAEDF